MQLEVCLNYAGSGLNIPHYVCLVRIENPFQRFRGSAGDRTGLSIYSSAGSEGVALSAGRIPSSTNSVRSPVA